MGSSIPVLPTSGAVERPPPVCAREVVPRWRTETMSTTPRWLVAFGLVAYCALIWVLVAAGGVAGVQFVARALH